MRSLRCDSSRKGVIFRRARTRTRIIIGLSVVAAVCCLLILDVVMFCTWRPRQEALLETPATFKPPITRKLTIASYLFVPVDTLRRFSNSFYRFTEDWSDSIHTKHYPSLRTPSPFLWRVATFYSDGTISSHEPYWGKVRHGWRFEWHKNGQKAFSAHDVRGTRSGLTTRWRRDGSKRFECSFVNGMNDGYETEWDSDGSVRARGLWKGDKKIDGAFEEQIYRVDGGTAFQAIIHYGDGKFIKIVNCDGTPVANAYYSVGNVPDPSNPSCLMSVRYVFADGIVTNAVDSYGTSVPRNQWREDFR